LPLADGALWSWALDAGRRRSGTAEPKDDDGGLPQGDLAASGRPSDTAVPRIFID
jgi:hypothetical protein